MKTIYLNKADMRSYSTSSNTVWDTIELQVPSDFEGGGKFYDLESKTWIDDVIPEPTIEEIKESQRNSLIFESKQLIAELKDAKEDLENGEMLEDEQTISEANERIAKIESRIEEIKIELKELNKEAIDHDN